MTMTPGVGFPSYGNTLTWTSSSSFASGYPVTNLSDLYMLSKPARAAASGSIGMLGVLPASQSIQLIALASHNLGSSDTFRVRGYSIAAPTIGTTGTVFDTGVINVFPTGSAPVLRSLREIGGGVAHR